MEKRQLDTEADNIELFKIRALRQLPGLMTLDIDQSIWQKMEKRFTQDKLTRITSSWLMLSLSLMLKIPYNLLTEKIAQKQPPRTAKATALVDRNIQQPPLKQRKLYRNIDEDINHDPIIRAKTGLFNSPPPKPGIRSVELKSIPSKYGYSDVRKTPGGTEVRAFYSNSRERYYKQVTPYKDDRDGMVNIERMRQAEFKNELSKLKLSRPPTSIKFTATLDSMVNGKNTPRRDIKATITKITCREVFDAHGSKTIDKAHGSNYHWSHLIAHFLGGEHIKDNIFPGTAASNYNTLEMVEEFIARKLLDDHIPSIEIHVETTYTEDALIPDEVKFHLSWKERGQDFTETTIINPRSHQRVKPGTLSTIDKERRSYVETISDSARLMKSWVDDEDEEQDEENDSSAANLNHRP